MEQLKEYLDTTNLSEDQKKAILGIVEAYGSEKHYPGDVLGERLFGY